jgi:hypothetical protein
MRKLTSIFICFIFSISQSYSQITLTESDFPSFDDTIRYSRVSNTIIDYTSSGAGITWDFSSLIPDSQYVKQFNPISAASFLVLATFGPFAQSDYKASYYNLNNDLPISQLSQFLPVSISDLNAYSKSTVDFLTALGYSINVNGQSVPFKSDTIETKYEFPLNFNSQYNSRGYTFVDFNPAADFKFKQYRQRNSSVDGWGTLITPMGSFDVLRIRHDINEIDSIYQTFFGAGTWIGAPSTSTTEYEWIGQAKKDVLLKIVQVNANANPQVRSIEYQDVNRYLDAGLTEITDDISVYPNIVSDKLHITSIAIIENFQILDLNGSEKIKGTVSGTNASISMENLSSGMYLLILKNGQGIKTLRIIKQ